MYKLTYYYIFKLTEKRNPDARFGAASFVFITQVAQCFLIFAVIKKIGGLNYPVFSDIYLINKIIMIPFMLIWLFLVNYYYKKRFDKIVSLFKDESIITFRNTIIVFSLLLIPIFIGIILLQK